MREILFRAKSDDIWEYGSFVKRSDTFRNYIETIDGYRCVVDPYTVCQYSGLNDKNGTKIFEVDIVKTVRYEKFVDYWIVKFDCGMFYFSSGDMRLTPDMFDDDYSDFSEVVGNIFDNPELVGGNENETN